MSFYTDVSQLSNKLLVRGYDSSGKRIIKQVNYKPYLFIKSNKDSKYKNITGHNLERMDFDSIWDARQFQNQYRNVSNFEIYGMNRFVYPYISDTYSGTIHYDVNKIKVMYIDIEVDSEGGFPDIDIANKHINAITYKVGNIITVLGLKDFDIYKIERIENKENIFYYKFNSEEELLTSFIQLWQAADIDVVTGWNCLPLTTTVWGKNIITTIAESKGDLFDSKFVQHSPITNKRKYKIELADGRILYASKDHRIPVRTCSPNSYTKLTYNNKNSQSLKDIDLTVNEMMNNTDEMFVRIPLRNNTNNDNEKYLLKELYLAGLIFTDGSLKDPKKERYGYTIYQSDYELLLSLDDYGLMSTISGNKTKGYCRYINPCMIGKAHDLIYFQGKKRLNVKELSSLSKKQFCAFFSGMLDGDGCVSHNSISLCNYENEIYNIAELLQWNGIYSTITNNMVRLIDFDYNDFCVRKNKRFKNNYKILLERKSSQKASQIRFKKIDYEYFIRVTNISETDEYCDMMDIETDTHYFIANGIKVHNCEMFDIPYIVRRLRVMLGDHAANKLSPWRKLIERKIESRGKEHTVYFPVGIAILDYIQLYKKFTYTQRESYSLNYISHVELGVKKIDYSNYDNLSDLYIKNHQLFIEYNIIDVELVCQLEDKLRLIELVYAMSYDAKVNYQDTLGSVLLWDVIIMNYLKDKNIIVNPMPNVSFRSFEGGYVKNPLIGMHEWVMSFDLTSLYPHLIMQYNISPETFIKRINIPSIDDILDKKELPHIDNASVTANGCLYRKDKYGFLSALMDLQFKLREDYKDRMKEAKKKLIETGDKEYEKEISRWNNAQMAKKIQLNSAYGALANQYFRWYDPNHAEAITLSGQLSIRWIANAVNEYMQNILKTTDDYIIAVDTDSIYVNFGPVVTKLKPKDAISFLDKIGKEKLEPFMHSKYEELARLTNAYANKMKMKREAISDRVIWRAKKNYIANVWDNEGIRFKEPELKMMGIEAVRSSTPEICRKKIKETIKLIVSSDEETVQKFIKDFKKDYYSLPFEDIAFPRSIKKLSKYYSKDNIYILGTPIHAKGSLLYNQELKRRKLTDKYSLIFEMDKIKYVYLREPNPIRDMVIAAPNTIPKEFGLEDYIDYDTMFVKSFLDPVKSFLDVIGWSHEKQETLLSFFQ